MALVALLLTPVRIEAQQGGAPAPRSQNPSPMVEHTRAHERVPQGAEPPGARFEVDIGTARPVQLFVPAGLRLSGTVPLLVHFHGAAHVPEHAVVESGGGYVTATVNAGVGTGAYDHAFRDPAVFDSLLARIERQLRSAAGTEVTPEPIVLSAFSAGHGAVRALVREPRHFARIDAALLLDGIHTSYVPERQVLHEGGQLDTTALLPWVQLARAAIDGEKAVLVTHSEVFPGTFASTTETTDYLVSTLGLRRTPVLRWGPVGMQQLSEAGAGRFEIRGFAGNSAPDHLDHLHGLQGFLEQLEALRATDRP